MIKHENKTISFWFVFLLCSIKLVAMAANGKKDSNNKSLVLFVDIIKTTKEIINVSSNFLNVAWMIKGLLAIEKSIENPKNKMTTVNIDKAKFSELFLK